MIREQTLEQENIGNPHMKDSSVLDFLKKWKSRSEASDTYKSKE